MKHHHYQPQVSDSDTETVMKFKNRRWWAKWISIGGIGTIAAVVIALPQIKEVLAYGHDFAISPISIKKLNDDTTAAIKQVQGEIDTLQLHEYEDKAWKAKTDEKLDEMKQLITRLLDNQERQNRYNSTQKQNNP